MNFQIERDFQKRLLRYEESGLLRQFGPARDSGKIDFYSNDYLGLAQSSADENSLQIPRDLDFGSGGSRLVSGNYPLLEELETNCARFFHSETCLFFSTGYQANLALLSAIANRHDAFFYDEKCHISLKDGMRLSMAPRFSFRHNQAEDLRKKLEANPVNGHRFVVIESIYSMDGDTCPLQELLDVCEKANAYLIVDEAHSTGTIGPLGKGLCVGLNLENRILGRVYTFGKAMGAGGAILAISNTFKEYLTNFSHPLIYSTSPSPVQAWICNRQLKRLATETHRIARLQEVISFWQEKVLLQKIDASKNFQSPVQYIPMPGNDAARTLANKLQSIDIQIKPMLYPTVSKGEERLRVSLHSYNLEEEIEVLLASIKDFQNNFGVRI